MLLGGLSAAPKTGREQRCRGPDARSAVQRNEAGDRSQDAFGGATSIDDGERAHFWVAGSSATAIFSRTQPRQRGDACYFDESQQLLPEHLLRAMSCYVWNHHFRELIRVNLFINNISSVIVNPKPSPHLHRTLVITT